MVNNSWKSVTLSQIGTFQKGSGISRAESNSGVLPAVRYGELYTVHNNYVRTYTSHISREGANKALRVHYGDVLFACSGETKEDIAKCAAIIDNSEVYAGGDIIVLSPTTEVDPIFLGFILNTPNVIQQRAQKAQGDAIVHISADSIKSIEITVPEYAEQIKIAKVLYDIDTLIVNLENLIAKKKAIKQGAMQELLTGKRRLEGYTGKWDKVKLGECCSFLSGGTPSKANNEWWNGTIPWISSSDISANDINRILISRFISQDALEHSATKLCPVHSVLIVSRVGVGKVAVNYRELCTSQDFTTLVPCLHDAHYLAYCLLPIMQEKARQAQGTSIKGITTDDISEIEVFLPEKDEQKAIASVLSDMDIDIQRLEQKLLKCCLVRQGMMSELLTGNIRLLDKEDV